MQDIDVRTVAQLGAVVRRLRHDRGWTQQQLADAARVSRVFISQLENGKSRAEIRLVLAVLQTLGTTLVVAHRLSIDDTDLLGEQPW